MSSGRLIEMDSNNDTLKRIERNSMEIEIIIQIVLLIFLISLSSFFSASETSLMSLNKIKLRHMQESNVKNANKIDDLLSNPDKMLGSILLGNNAANSGATAVATALALSLFPESSGGVAYVTAIMTFLILVFGEITPKNLAVQYSEKIALFVAPIILLFSKILYPVIYILTIITNSLIKLLGGDVHLKKPFITPEELKTIVDVSNQEGILENEETEMIYNIFDFANLRIKDLMVQRTDIVAVSSDATYDEVMELFKNLSRLPVYDDTIDNIIGILYSKDLFYANIDSQIKEKFDVTQYVRKPLMTFEFIRINDFFKQMQGHRSHMAIALDEYGGVAGLVTMEDIIESIFGEINDEFDEVEDSDIQMIKENEYVVNGTMRLEELNELLGTNFESEDFESIGGFLIGILGRLPQNDELINYETVRFVIENVEKNRINKIRIFI